MRRIEKDFLVAARLVGVRGRGGLRVFLSFDGGPVGMRGREFLDCSSCFEREWKEEWGAACLFYGRPSVGLWVKRR